MKRPTKRRKPIYSPRPGWATVYVQYPSGEFVYQTPFRRVLPDPPKKRRKR